jgi:prefoldin subunit 5
MHERKENTMIKENISCLERRLAELEQAVRDTRRLIARFRKAEALDRETALLADGAEAALAGTLTRRAAAIREAFQCASAVYAADIPLDE